PTAAASDEALKAAEELLGDEYAPELSNGEHDWLKHNIARLCDWFAADRVADQILTLSDDQVVASLVREYNSAEKAVAAAHKTQITVLQAIIDSYQRQPTR